MIKEARLFSEGLKSGVIAKNLRAGSVSDADAKVRQGQYQKMFNNFTEMKEGFKTFSGYLETPLLSNQYFNASVTAYVNSFAGFLSIERSMDAPQALLHYLDMLGVTDNRKVLPNLGAEDKSGINAGTSLAIATVTDPASGNTTLDPSTKVVPGSVILKFYAGAVVVATVTDDRNGNLIAGANLIEVGSVNYTTGIVTVKPTDNLYTTLVGDQVVYTYVADVASATTDGKNRFKTDLENVIVNTEADLLIGESNLITLAAMQKTLGVDPQAFMSMKLTQLYTELINDRLANAITGAYVGTNLAVDISVATTGFTDYRSAVDAFSAGLIDVDGALASKSTKGVRATSYLVAPDVADQFRKTKTIGLWSDNVSATHIDDLVGFYDGVPVLRSKTIGAGTGYACHKTADGNLAPTMRGIFLPLTNTPAIGNYNNPSQFAQGVYYQEAAQSIAPELAQKFTLTV